MGGILRDNLGEGNCESKIAARQWGVNFLPRGIKMSRRALRVRRVNFGTGREFGTDVAKRYGEGSGMLVFPGEKDRTTVQIVKNYGGSKILRIRAPYYF